ncbi:3-phosphoshikimate 1-carboxyvinyltransferase [Fervidicella metallireducens AeB]|uniref:3-phosphoshikimate 1-carboxyvinyltransferase n=1 Tax=Fervidicella metallireducens AeB TaxID=1403537 RepID=A0A017RW35_9CLOT|nr:3-phosphoshikimate 1-carboxyvinyltransferase [Fervidicella metallireducens]EYE88589.1 3-phosphoshikimate 1-carboxyvinyltransferase [Fervidicella metallireducens AeB]
MNNIKIVPSELEGHISIPPSKSITHRAIICAGLSNGKSHIENIIFSEDISATLEGMSSFGIKYEKFKEDRDRYSLIIEGKTPLRALSTTIDCRESGSTLRFLIPIACILGKEITFTGKGKLIERPLDEYYKIFDKQNIPYKNLKGNLPLRICGKLKGDTFSLRGDVSSQFISGLMFALPLLKEDSKIIISTDLESKGYVDLTIDVLNSFGIKIQNNDYREFFIEGNQKYIPQTYKVEGDFSQASFWLVAGLLGNKITCTDINVSSLQGDKVILDIIKNMGGNVEISETGIIAKKSKTKGTIIDVSQCPDLVPILATLASLSQGTTRIINAARVRIKESDRLKAISTELNKLGAEITELEDGLIIKGKEFLNGGEVDSWKDHRIAMALAVSSIRCLNPVIIKDSSCVSKSYPGFWDDFRALGGKFNN